MTIGSFLEFQNYDFFLDELVGADGKSSDKANAMRSKHSVTEQRRRSKINERYAIFGGFYYC